MEIKILATKEERLNLLYRSLCNGFAHLYGFGLEYDYNSNAYDTARERLAKASTEKVMQTGILDLAAIPCFEDILIEMIREGGSIQLNDVENYGDPTEVGKLNMDRLDRNWDKVPAELIMQFIKDDDDMHTALTFMQYIAFGEQVYA